VLEREGVELAFLAALQHLPGTQRAVLILREVLGYSAAEAAAMLDTTPASVNSALQRARAAVEERVPGRSQQAELARLGDEGVRALVDQFVAAWERADLPALVGLLAEDAQFTMPPLPAWFDGRDSVRRFIAERVFATPWRLVPLWANAQPGFACYLRQPGEDRFTLGAVNVVSIRDGLITRINGFLDPAMFARLRVPNGWPAGRSSRRPMNPAAPPSLYDRTVNRLREERQYAQADRHQHRLARRLLRGPRRQRDGAADGPRVRRLLRRAAWDGRNPPARAQQLRPVLELLARGCQ
jgi:ketosteroid isomerase-like protein